jgi:hypothetical protein
LITWVIMIITSCSTTWNCDTYLIHTWSNSLAHRVSSVLQNQTRTFSRIHASRNQQCAYPRHAWCHLLLAQAAWRHYGPVWLETCGTCLVKSVAWELPEISMKFALRGK